MMEKNNCIELKYYILYPECLHRYVTFDDKLMIFIMGYKRITLNYITHSNFPRELVIYDINKGKDFKLIGKSTVYGINFDSLVHEIILPQFDNNGHILKFFYDRMPLSNKSR